MDVFSTDGLNSQSVVTGVITYYIFGVNLMNIFMFILGTNLYKNVVHVM